MKKIFSIILCFSFIMIGSFSVIANPVVDMHGKSVVVSKQLDISKLSNEEVRQVMLYYEMKKERIPETTSLGPLGIYWEQKLNHER